MDSQINDAKPSRKGEPMKIEVTQEDIDKGLRFSSLLCPISLAVQRCLNIPSCKVIPGMISFGNNEYDLPDPVNRFIVAFDTRRPVQPFTFEL